MNTNGSEIESHELRLSPSETAAHNAAMRLAGAANEHIEAKTQRALASITIGFELIIVVLIGLAIFGLNLLEPRELGLWIAGGLAVLSILALAVMRFGRAGIVLGWCLHACMLATALILPAALFVSILFTALWIFCMYKGAQIDRNRAQWLAAQSG